MALRMILSIQKHTKVLITAALLVLLIIILFTKASSDLTELTYIITETRGIDSFDPISADSTQNLPVMRMLYATPLESGDGNSLESSILSEFRYNSETRTIHFRVKPGLSFADGQKLTAEDVALAITRMAYFRPTFPVIKNIVGVAEWSERKQGIVSPPAGIVIQDDSIVIHLDRPHVNPLFRFCLELFSIIPKSCVDLTSGKLSCRQPAFSGYFRLADASLNETSFAIRSEDGAPKLKQKISKVTFRYQTLEEACSRKLKIDEVIAGSETEFLVSNCRNLVADKQIHWLPSARFLVLRFNPHHSLFLRREARQYFAERVRQVLRQDANSVDVQRGLFSRLLPGYLSSAEFPEPDERFASSFKDKEIVLPVGGPNIVSAASSAVIEVAHQLGMRVETVEPSNQAESVAKFINGEFAVTVGGSGFWAQDPVGDLTMWFTKNLHKTMTFAWEDDGIYSRLYELENELDPKQIKTKMESFNQYLYDQSIIAPIVHFRRLFISSSLAGDLLIPQAITSPAPWQLTVKQ